MDEIKHEVEDETKKKGEINLRREARRRKILENAKDRLDKLNGRVGSGGDIVNVPKVEQSCEYLDPEVEPDIPTSPFRGVQAQGAFNVDYNELFSTLSGVEPNREQKKKPYLIASRAHIVLAAAIACVLSLVGDVGLGEYGIGVSAFFPALLAVALELLFFRGQRQIRPIMNLFITICGFKAQEANRLLHFLSTIQSLIIDMGIFLFFFCSLTFVVTCVNERFVDIVVIK